MAEISLMTITKYIEKEKYISWMPKGSAISVIDTKRMRNKWLEIVCDLMQPIKRDKYPNFPGREHIISHWTKQLHDEYVELRHSGVSLEKMDSQEMWDRVVDPQLIAQLGKDPRGQKDCTDTWVWSDYEKQVFFIVVNENESLIRAWEGFNTRYDNSTIYVTPRVVYNYEVDSAISSETLTDIADRNIIVQPKFDSPVDKTKFNEPDLADI